MNSVRIPAWFLMMCFIGPLALLAWPIAADMHPVQRRVIREGTMFSFLALLLLFSCRVLTGAPLIGALFSLLLIFIWMLYVIAAIAIISIKLREPNWSIPFISHYAEQWEKW